jgi:hypothetical protein
MLVADQKLGDALGSQPILNRWENTPSARELLHFDAKARKGSRRMECPDSTRHAAHNAVYLSVYAAYLTPQSADKEQGYGAELSA